MIKLRVALAALAAALLLAVPAGASASAGRSEATMRAHDRTVTVDVAIDRFATRHHHAVALATASSRVPTSGGRSRTVRQRVTLAVKTGTSCRILTLHLATLKLTLLGLTVDTSAVNLRITGDQSGALGQLFCKLASGLKLKSGARLASAARALNQHMHHRRLHALRFKARISPQAQAAQAPPTATCPVLSLTLGPLNLDLLGLFVDLYGPTTKAPVTVTIVADPNGGALGKLFCQLAANAQSSSTAPAS
jgi:hypothetical protein